MIRAALPHAAAMALVHAAAFPPNEAWNESVIAEQLDLAGRFGFLHPEGGMVLARIVADESEILTLAVAPEARRAGIGRALMQAAMDQAMRYGAQAMFLEVAAGNAAGRALYDRCGFTEIGLRRGYYQDGSDALVLRTRLVPPEP